MTDPFVTALHEIGHALAQATLGVGPATVSIMHVEDRWQGQSLPDEDANTNEKFVRLLVTQLAGPIAQIVRAPKSLGDLAAVYGTQLLIPSFSLYFQAGQPLKELGWTGDLGHSGLIFLARGVEAVWQKPQYYIHGGFLYYAEQALFSAYSEKSLGATMDKLARSLVVVKTMSKELFLNEAKEALELPAWNPLRELDLTFVPPF
jgi:hypothetical protein